MLAAELRPPANSKRAKTLSNVEPEVGKASVMPLMRDDTETAESPTGRRAWLTPGVGGIGTASVLADVGHEVPTALLPSFVTTTLSAPAAALGLIEGIADGLASRGRVIRRRHNLR